MEASLSEARLEKVQRCLNGQFEYAGTAEPRMTCTGSCHIGLHGLKCAQLSQGSIRLGFFTCAYCRLEEMMPDLPRSCYSPEAVRQALRSMLQSLSMGRESTSNGFSDYARLEMEWAKMMGGGSIPAQLVMPVDGASSFKAFLLWVATDRQRAKSLESLFRSIGSYMLRTGRPNLAGMADVKQVYNDLTDKLGVERSPRTAATPRMLKLMLGEPLLTKVCPKLLVRARRG